MPRARDLLPRSLLPLAALLVVAGGWLWLDGRRPPAADRAAVADGGAIRLIPFLPDEIERIEVGRVDGVILLARDAGDAWRFTRGCDDRADAGAIAELTGILAETEALPLLPETAAGEEAADFGLSGDEAVTLRVTARDGRAIACAVGRRNPVRGACYALIDGRPGTWTLPYTLRVRLLSLPDIARLRRLWPEFAPAAVETLALRPAGAPAPDLFARDAAGAWWLRAPADGIARAGAVFAAYVRLYGDRVTRRDGADWWRARDRAVDNLAFQLGLVGVKAFGPRAAPAAALRTAGLLPAPLSVRVVLRGGATMRAAFGDPAGEREQFALRDGRPNLLRVDTGFAKFAAAPLADLLRTDALPFALARADSFTLELAGRAPVRAWRREAAWTTSLASTPGAAASAAELVTDLVTSLDRLPIVRPLPPAPAGRDPLAAENRFIVTVWRDGRAAPDLEARFGGLAAPGAAATEAALWVPATGQLLVVPGVIIDSLRALFLGVGGAAAG